MLTVKIVDRSDHNAVSSALIKLLHECIGKIVKTYMVLSLMVL